MAGTFQWLSYFGTFTETSSAPDQAMAAANNFGEPGPSVIPETEDLKQSLREFGGMRN